MLSHDTPAPRSPQDGGALKGAALASLEASRAKLILRARRAFLRYGLEHGQVCADDIRDAIELPAGVGPKALGCVPGPLARAGIVERIGFRNSSRPESHARSISVWKLVDRSAAERWLDQNPAPVEDHSDVAVPADDSSQGLLFDLGRPSAVAEGL